MTTRRIALLALLTAPLLACDSGGSGLFATSASGSGPTLSGLNITAGALSPAFNSSTTAYSATVSNTTTSIRVIPSASPGNTVRVNGTVVASGAESPDIPLVVGTNTISVQVQGSGGSRTYTISVLRSG